MKSSVIATIVGVTAFSAGCAATGIACAGYVKNIDNKFTNISGGIKYIQDNIKLDIPEEVASELVKSLSKDIAAEQVKKASEAACAEVAKDMKNVIKGNVANAYSSIEDTLKDKLEKEINIQTIERIENKVAEKVAKQIVNKALFSGQSGSTGTSKESIINTCVANGMDAWEIKRILDAAK